jgi:hypothetical protein
MDCRYQSRSGLGGIDLKSGASSLSACNTALTLKLWRMSSTSAPTP